MIGSVAASGMAAAAARPVARLRSARDIRAVLAARCAASSPVATVHARRRPDAGPPRMTVAAGKAVGNAVQRNRVKRRLRGALRGAAWPAGGDFVVVGRAAALAAEAAALRAQVRRQVAAAWARCA